MDDAVGHALQHDGTEEEDDQHDVRVNGRNVDDLGVLRDALDHTQVDQRPRYQEADGDLPIEVVDGLQVGGDIQCFPIPEVLRR